RSILRALVVRHCSPPIKQRTRQCELSRTSEKYRWRKCVIWNAARAPISSNAVCGPCDSFPCTLHERIKNSCTEFQGEKSMIICDLCGEAKDRSEERRVGKECRCGWWQCVYRE